MKLKINWISSNKNKNKSALAQFSKKLEHFYSQNVHYYSEIDFTSNNWINGKELAYDEIVNQARRAASILEVGCGRANILKHHNIQEKYTGIDFSEYLFHENKKKYPNAKFEFFKKYNHLPFSNNSFDLVYSVFVIEHSVFPVELLAEMTRVTKPGGALIILCPDFLGRNRMTSQLSGLSVGSGRLKFSKKKYFDSLITGWDNKIRIPLICLYKKCKIRFFSRTGFLININPICFITNIFEPDFDAVYLTYRFEMKKYLSPNFQFIKNKKELKLFERNKKLIFLKGIKKTNE